MVSRVRALEGNVQPDAWPRWHRLICQPGQSVEDAKVAYGLDKIAEGDMFVVRTFVTPRFDAEGDMIFHKDWPENQG